MIIQYLVFSALASFLSVWYITPRIIKSLHKKGLVTRDIHKQGEARVVEPGGIIILLGFTFGLLFLSPVVKLAALPILLAIVMGLMGFYDDFVGLKRKGKLLVPIILGFPLALLPIQVLYLHGYEILVLGSAYPVFALLLFMAATNWTNMLAGFNGLETGLGVISLTALASCALIIGSPAFFVFLPMIFSLLAFLLYNKYPAKIFPGDSGTLPIGALLASTALVYKLEPFLLIILIPYAMDALLKFLTTGLMLREEQKPVFYEKGFLRVPENSNLSLPKLILRIRPMSEKKLVYTIWLIEVVFCLIAINLAI